MINEKNSFRIFTPSQGFEEIKGIVPENRLAMYYLAEIIDRYSKFENPNKFIRNNHKKFKEIFSKDFPNTDLNETILNIGISPDTLWLIKHNSRRIKYE